MKVLVIGNGGREHALAWKAAQSPLVEKVFVAPGNPGTQTENKITNVNISATDIPALINFAQTETIDLTIVGPEAPLVLGIVDDFKAAGLKIFGPSKAAAQLEGSKSFTKDFLARHNIPTAHYSVFTETDKALAYLDKVGAPIVIKADGLAAGKGVIVAMDLAEAKAAVTDMLSGNAFGEAGSRVVIEEFLTGEEASFIVMVDGNNVVPMATSQDHKRVGDGDTGPNTGGMGAYAPTPLVNDDIYKKLEDRVIKPTLKGMQEENAPFEGVLFIGVMVVKGEPIVLEYNVRFGDPECEILMPLIESKVSELFYYGATKQLDKLDIKFKSKFAVGVVVASSNYPYSASAPSIISLSNIVDRELLENSHISFAGVEEKDGNLIATGGRVAVCVGLGDNIQEARDRAYLLSSEISFDGKKFRTDIAYQALKN